MDRPSLCRLVNKGLHRIGLHVSLRDAPVVCGTNALDQADTLVWLEWFRLRSGYKPAMIVDVGASDGRWAKPAMALFPESEFVLIEPLDEHQQSLQALCRDTRVHYYKGLVGGSAGEVSFNQDKHHSSIYGNASGEKFGLRSVLSITTLDQLWSDKGYVLPDIIKLDIQGAELQALQGGVSLLKNAELVQLECSFIPFQQGIPLVDEIVSYMSSVGFRVFNIFGVYGRPLDGMPAQGECLFIKRDSALISDYRWAEGLEWS